MGMTIRVVRAAPTLVLRRKGLQPETQSWILRAGSQPSWLQIGIVDAFIGALKASGAWWLLDAVYLPAAAPDAVTACLNLRSTSYTLTPVNQPLFSPGFGWSGNGTTAYLDSGCSLSAAGHYALNSGSMAMWQTTDFPGPTFLMGSGVAQAGQPSTRAAMRGRNGLSTGAYLNDNTISTLTSYSGAGFMCASRTDANTLFSGRGGAGYTSYTIPSIGVPGGTVTFGRLGGGNNYDPNQWAFGMIGAGLSQTQMDSVYQATLAALLALGTVANDNLPEPVSFNYGCFSQAQLAQITPAGLLVSMEAPPPANDQVTAATYIYSPVSISSTQQVDQLVASTSTLVLAEHFLWGNRPEATPGTGGYPNVRPNLGAPTIYSPSSKRECRYQFSNQSKAFASWLIQQRYSAGALPRNDTRYADGMGWLDLADQAGFNTAPWASVTGANLTTNVAIDTGGSAGAGNAIVHQAQLTANPDSYFTTPIQSYAVATDVVYLPVARLEDCQSMPQYGFCLDAELQTNVAPADWLAFVQRCAASCHTTGHKLTLYPNPLNAAGATATGFSTTNIDAIAAAVDWLAITAYNGNVEKSIPKSVGNQVAMFQGAVPWHKIMLTAGIGAPGQEMAVSDATWLNGWMVANDVGRLMVWRDGAAQGGPATTKANQALAALMGIAA